MPEHTVSNAWEQDWPTKAKAGLRVLKQRWDEALLLVLLASMLLMVGYLLWPQPQARLVLQPFPPGSGKLVSTSDGLGSVSASLGLTSVDGENGLTPDSDASSAETPQKHKKPRHPHHPKKPAKPPILNLNTATREQLQLLPGIGPKMAERVLEYRKTQGRFTSIEGIMDVKGIGAKKFEKMKPFLKV